MVRYGRVLAAIITLLLVVVGTLVFLSFEQPNSNSTFETSKNPSVPEFSARNCASQNDQSFPILRNLNLTNQTNHLQKYIKINWETKTQ
jgi:hypothetical protein